MATRKDHVPGYCERGRAAARCIALMPPQKTSRKHGRRHVYFVCSVVLFAVGLGFDSRHLHGCCSISADSTKHLREVRAHTPLHIPPFSPFRQTFPMGAGGRGDDDGGAEGARRRGRE